MDAMSADGSVLGGYQEMTDGYWAASVWIGGTQYLPTYGGEPLQQVGDVSDNGQYAVGGGGYATEGRAYLWNKDTGVTLLDNPFAADGWELRATCVNEDGTVVIGVGQNFWFERMGWIWTPQTGTVSLESFAAQYPGYNGEYLMGPTSISPNGQYITGWGVDAMGFSAVSFVIQRWATLTPTSTSVGLGSIVSGDNGSLASDDGSALKICKAFVPLVSAPRIRFDSDFTSPYAAASKVEVTLKARMTTGGAFKVRTFVADRTGNSYTYSPASQVVADTSLGLSFGTFSGSSLIPSMTIGPDMTMRARVEIQQTGFSAVAVPCAEFEKLNLTVTP